MSEPVIAQKSPIPVEVKAGQTYYWCSCGKSAKEKVTAKIPIIIFGI